MSLVIITAAFMLIGLPHIDEITPENFSM